jgi:hypothetical protein
MLQELLTTWRVFDKKLFGLRFLLSVYLGIFNQGDRFQSFDPGEENLIIRIKCHSGIRKTIVRHHIRDMFGKDL